MAAALDSGIVFQGPAPWLVAHRGDAFGAPENTLVAFELAAATGADAVELDVQLSKDGVPVVIHDRYLDRTTNGVGPVRSQAWAELRALDAGSWCDSRFRGERIPSLEEALTWACRAGIPLLAEVRTHPFLDVDAAEPLARLLDGAGNLPLVLFSSDHRLIRDLADALPTVARGLMVNTHTPFLRRSLVGPDCSLLSQPVDVLTPLTVAMAHDLGCLVASGIRQPGDLATLLSWDVDLLVSDEIRVGALRKAMDEAGAIRA
ncbi:MAG: glycerophosphodiester phosphodiesterase [Candidatus Dormibacteraeota bacterium]|nr:glycerophosphodiester phosphodiesterase [Candidatus Dormibacteraeota bacterium]